MKKKEQYETLVVQGTTYKTLLTNKYLNRKKWERPDAKLVKSVLPGNILKVFVKEGQKVKVGSKLLILEAMKMKNEFVSPVAGVIKTIHIKEGVRVPKHELLITIE